MRDTFMHMSCDVPSPVGSCPDITLKTDTWARKCSSVCGMQKVSAGRDWACLSETLRTDARNRV